MGDFIKRDDALALLRNCIWGKAQREAIDELLRLPAADVVDRHAALEVFCEYCGVCPDGKKDPENCDDILYGVLKRLPPADGKKGGS